MLKALALARSAPLWQIVTDAVDAYVAALPADERRLPVQIAKRAR